ncbi:MAG: hypothetical protein WEB00_04050 [Dehalococcoidia bacterium]
MKTLAALTALLLIGLIAAGCGDDDDDSSTAEETEPEGTGTSEEDLHAPERLTAGYDPQLDPADFVHPIVDPNPYFPLTPGTTWIYEDETEDGVERVEVSVTDETKEIIGITATVVLDEVFIDDELAESTFDWFAQDTEGNVWYLGEETAEYENGEVVSTEGSFEAGADGAHAGIVMLADPQVGDEYLQEFYVGEAEDYAKVLALGESVDIAFGSFDNCLKTEDVNPLSAGGGVENKYYCPDVGFVLETNVEDPEGQLELIEIVEE